MSTKNIVRAGGALVWRLKGRTLEVLLIHRPRYDDWSWPKGKLDPGETLPACAVREVREETGYEVALGQPLPAVKYQLKDSRKECYYWAAQVIEEDHPAVIARPTAKDCSKHEVDEVKWLSAKKALKLLTRKEDGKPLDLLIDLHEDGKLDTRPLMVIRHGRAQKRSAHKGDEETRPLTKPGLQQAEHLIPLLGAYGIDEVISSPWKRCFDTAVPYAKAAELAVVQAPELTEHAAKSQPAVARKVVRGMIHEPRVATAVCTHRPVLPMVLEAIEPNATRVASRALPQEDPYLRVGETLVAHIADRTGRSPKVVAIEIHRPLLFASK